MSSNGRMGRNPFQKKAPQVAADGTPAPLQAEKVGEVEAAPLLEQAQETKVENASAPAETVQFIAAPSQNLEPSGIRNSDSESAIESDDEVPSWMKAVAITYRVALLTRFGAQVAVAEAQHFLHERLRQHQQEKRHGRN